MHSVVYSFQNFRIFSLFFFLYWLSSPFFGSHELIHILSCFWNKKKSIVERSSASSDQNALRPFNRVCVYAVHGVWCATGCRGSMLFIEPHRLNATSNHNYTRYCDYLPDSHSTIDRYIHTCTLYI